MFACLYKPAMPGSVNTGLKPCATSAESSDPFSGASLLEVARTFSPRVDARPNRMVTLDVDGLERLFGDHRAIGDRLRRAAAAAGLGPVHVAIAATRTAAMLLAAARAGVTVVPPGGEQAALAELPLRILATLIATDEKGVGPIFRSGRRENRSDPFSAPDPAVLPVLARWGIRTLGQLAALPAAELSERTGQAGVLWQRLARGEDPEPLVPARDEEPFDASSELEWPIEGLEPLSFVLGGLLDPLCQRLERRDRGAAVLHLHLRLVTRETHSRMLQLPAPMRDPKVLRTLLLLDLESHPAPAGIDRVTVTIVPTPGRIIQESLLTRARPAPEQVSTLLARLGALMGESRCGSPALVDSHRPGAFAMTPFRVADKDTVNTRLKPCATSFGHAGLQTEGSLSVRGTGLQPCVTPKVALRRFRLPIPARVLIDQGRPIQVRTDRPGLAGGRVSGCAGPWRTSGEWWKRSAAAGASGLEALRGLIGWNRDEWDVALGDGGIYRIFEDRDSGRWFMDAIVD